MKKLIVGTSLVLLAGLAMIAVAQQQPDVSELRRQLMKLNESVKGTGVTPDINAPVSPSLAPNPGLPGTVPANLPAGPGVPPAMSGADQNTAVVQGLGGAVSQAPNQGGSAQPPLAGGPNPSTGTVDVNSVNAGQQAAKTLAQNEPPPLSIREQAFEDMTRTSLPMTPDQIRTLKSMFDQSQKAAAEHPGTPPKPTSNSQIVDLSPGATPPIIRLQAGFVTSIVFLDATGAPWPIAAYDIGDPRSFNVQWDQKGNTMMVQAISAYKTGNLAVILRDLNTPIMLTLLPGQKAVDYRVDLRMPGVGPNSVTTVTHLPGKESPVLLDVLNGVPPQGSTTLKISGCSKCSGWLYNGEIYFRTTLTVLSPGWIATLSSADGMHAYQLPSTPVILVSDKGKMNTLTVEGF